MDDERLKDPKWDYFDELLDRIREIRSSELRFYQKIRDLFTLSEDYHANEKDTDLLFAEVQKKRFSRSPVIPPPNWWYSVQMQRNPI